MKLSLDRLRYDWQYIWLNRIVNQIPSWKVRRFFYIRCGMKISTNARIGIGTIILEPAKISVGERSVINEQCLLDGRGGLYIGQDTSISMNAKILSASHKEDSFRYIARKTIIGNHVWIGTNALILDGSKIENFVIVGAGAVMKGKTEMGDVLIGNPARVVRKRRKVVDYHLMHKPYFR